jgi:hypothetical protein
MVSPANRATTRRAALGRLLTARYAGRVLDSMTKGHTGSSNRAAKGARIVKPRDSSHHNSGL